MRLEGWWWCTGHKVGLESVLAEKEKIDFSFSFLFFYFECQNHIEDEPWALKSSFADFRFGLKAQKKKMPGQYLDKISSVVTKPSAECWICNTVYINDQSCLRNEFCCVFWRLKLREMSYLVLILKVTRAEMSAAVKLPIQSLSSCQSNCHLQLDQGAPDIATLRHWDH